MVRSITKDYDYKTTVEGRIPEELQSIIYINGPGIFETEGLRKRHILHSDGMIQAFRIMDGKVHFQNKFVRTPKYAEESAAGRFLYATWTTQASCGVLGNFLGCRLKSQAGIIAITHNDRLYAFDDSRPSCELNATTLVTKGSSSLGMP